MRGMVGYKIVNKVVHSVVLQPETSLLVDKDCIVVTRGNGELLAGNIKVLLVSR